MFIEERHRHILALLKEKGRVEVAELSKIFQISEDSIRRDLRLMEEKGQVKRTYGGAILPNKVGEVLNYQEREELNSDLKGSIAKFAASLVQEGDTILLDSSSTISRIVPWLAKTETLTIITNSLAIAYNVIQMNQVGKLFIIGGVVDPDRAGTAGIECLHMLQKIAVDKAFIGPCSISTELDLWSTSFDEAELKKAMIKAAREVFIVADSSKFGQRSLAKIGPLQKDYQCITDQGVTKETLIKLQERIKDGLMIAPEGDNINGIRP